MNTPPESIGTYTISRELGRGGMGIVYLGRDTRLDRDIAIKAIPEQLALDPDRLARFEREARTLAQLNHPNIAGIYGVEEHDGARYLVLEYVEGETLAERLDRGPLPIDEAIEIATQIAAGLEEAHEAGIVHRDLKPGNVIVTPEGRAKVLDFGLARMDEATSSTGAVSENPTITSPAMHSPTVPGVILGTAAYMSPEQARGRRVDRRTDVWSFGVILYEMLAGASPFVGETVSDSIGAVLHKNIDLTLLPDGTPSGVRRALQRCVERDKSLRFRDIGDVRVELLRASGESVDVGRAPAPGGTRSIWLIAIVLAIISSVSVWFIAQAIRPEPVAAVRKFDVVTAASGNSLVDAGPKISPDGSMIAYTEDDQILVRNLGSFESRMLLEPSSVENIFWSPDSAWIGFYDHHAIYKVALAGGASIRLTAEPLDLSVVAGGGWTNDDRIFFSDDEKGIMVVSALGGDARVVLPIDESTTIDYHDVSVIPNTGAALFYEHRRDLSFVLIALEGERKVEVMPPDESFPTTPVYSPTGHLLFSRGPTARSIWAVKFDAENLKCAGEPFLVATNATHASASSDGSMAMLRGGFTPSGGLTWVTREGDTMPIEGEFDSVFGPLLSPDGKQLAYSRGEPSRMDVWVRDLERGVDSRITFLEGMVAPRAWSEDGTEIVINQYLPESGVMVRSYFQATDGTGETRPSIDTMVLAIDKSWQMAVVTDGGLGADSDLFTINLENASERSKIVSARFDIRSVSLNPQGDLMLFVSSRSGESQVFCTRFPSGEGRWQVSTNGGRRPSWAADGKSVYFQGVEDDEALYEVDVEVEPSIRFGVPSRIIDGTKSGITLDAGWSVTSDGQRVVAPIESEEQTEDRASIAIIQNWIMEHQRN